MKIPSVSFETTPMVNTTAEANTDSVSESNAFGKASLELFYHIRDLLKNAGHF
jgi:hypothetical protein